MKNNRMRFKNLILTAIILTLVLVVLARENEHTNQLLAITEKELQREEARLETYRQFTENYNELQNSYDELYQEYIKHVEYVWQTFICTGYSADDPLQGTNNIVATNFNLDYENVCNLRIIATDPKVIPLYSIVEIKGLGAYISLDTGGAIKGNKIDILFDTKEEALEFGRQILEVRVIE